MNDIEPKILRNQTKWSDLFFYRKAVVLYVMTTVFCRRFLAHMGDRTVDQMIQAARSGKQNIVEGYADGMTSSEMELKLLNVARGSLQELREDYVDFLNRFNQRLWTPANERYDRLLNYCRTHNDLADYEPHFHTWTSEEMANCAITLCHMVDKMMMTHLAKRERDFVQNGGIRERMTAARLQQRRNQNEVIQEQQREIDALKAEITRLKAKLES